MNRHFRKDARRRRRATDRGVVFRPGSARQSAPARAGRRGRSPPQTQATGMARRNLDRARGTTSPRIAKRSQCKRGAPTVGMACRHLDRARSQASQSAKCRSGSSGGTRREARYREELSRSFRNNEGSPSQVSEWDSAQHPRGGDPQNRGRFSPAGGAGGVSVSSRYQSSPSRAAVLNAKALTVKPEPPAERKADSADSPKWVSQYDAPPNMVALAKAWRETHQLLQRFRRDIETLPKNIANSRSQVASGGRYAYIHSNYLAKAQQELEAAKALVPELESQLGELEAKYHELGYDDVEYSTWTPAETIISGRGIAKVGDAIHHGGTPAGLRPTGDEVAIALTAVSVFQLGRWALGKALIKAPRGIPNLQYPTRNSGISRKIYTRA